MTVHSSPARRRRALVTSLTCLAAGLGAGLVLGAAAATLATPPAPASAPARRPRPSRHRAAAGTRPLGWASVRPGIRPRDGSTGRHRPRRLQTGPAAR